MSVSVAWFALAITMLKTCVAAVPTPLLALMLPVKVPAAVGVPVMAPVVVFKVRLVGRLPLATAKVGAGLPLAATVKL